MTPAPWQGTRPPDRVRHSWRCTRRAPLVETIRTDPVGRPQVVSQCTECEATDAAWQVRAEAERGGAT